MLLYYHSWMFHNHFIATLYHFLGLTCLHSAKVPVAIFACFLLHRILVPNGFQSRRNFLEIFFGPEEGQWAKEVTRREPRPPTTHQGTRGPGVPWWVVAALGTPSTASELYKYPNIPETLEESTKNTSSHRKFQNREIQSNTITEGFIFIIGASPMMRE